jgi:hypothetical protein
VKIGREPFDASIRRDLEAQNPGVVFDWAKLSIIPIPAPDVEYWRERRRAEKAAKQARRELEAEASGALDEAGDVEPLSGARGEHAIEAALESQPLRTAMVELEAPMDVAPNDSGGEFDSAGTGKPSIEPSAVDTAGNLRSAPSGRRRRRGRRRRHGSPPGAGNSGGLQSESTGPGPAPEPEVADASKKHDGPAKEA